MAKARRRRRGERGATTRAAVTTTAAMEARTMGGAVGEVAGDNYGGGDDNYATVNEENGVEQPGDNRQK
jgi:hypothetical protein